METRYIKLETVGEGGAGTVFRAWDSKLGRQVALKRVKSVADQQYQREAVNAMNREVCALAALQHPNVVTLLDAGRDGEGNYVVMEYLNGEDLESAVAQAVLPPGDFAKVAGQILDGLEATHAAGLVHEDLKPSNVRLDWTASGSFVAKLVDFGLARSSDGVLGPQKGERVWGTTQYMAPERFSGALPSPGTDLYAAGCLFYFLLTGQHAVEGGSMAEVAHKHRTHQIKPLETLRDDVPAALCRWVHWLMNPNPAQRPASAAAAAAWLRAASETGPVALAA